MIFIFSSGRCIIFVKTGTRQILHLPCDGLHIFQSSDFLFCALVGQVRSAKCFQRIPDRCSAKEKADSSDIVTESKLDFLSGKVHIVHIIILNILLKIKYSKNCNFRQFHRQIIACCDCPTHRIKLLEIPKNRILFWSHTNNYNVASYRIRCNAVVRALRKLLLDVEIHNSGELDTLNFVPSILVLSKRLDLESLTTAVKFKQQHGTHLVLDVCDSIFPVPQNGHSNSTDTQINKFSDIDAKVTLMRNFDQIVTPSTYLSELYKQHIGKNPGYSVITDIAENFMPSDLTAHLRFPKRHVLAWNLKRKLATSSVEIGRRLLWYGIGDNNWGNGMADLSMLFEALSKHNDQKRLSLSVISNNSNIYDNLFFSVDFKTHYLKWHYSTFGMIAAVHDIVLIPVQKNAYSLGKSANRMTTAFNNNLAVAATRIPSYENFSSTAVFDNWNQGLEQLMSDSKERIRRIRNAKEIIECNFQHQSSCGKMDEFTQFPWVLTHSE